MSPGRFLSVISFLSSVWDAKPMSSTSPPLPLGFSILFSFVKMEGVHIYFLCFATIFD